jgi:hypothetical protein
VLVVGDGPLRLRPQLEIGLVAQYPVEGAAYSRLHRPLPHHHRSGGPPDPKAAVIAQYVDGHAGHVDREALAPVELAGLTAERVQGGLPR